MREPLTAADAWLEELPASFSALVVAPLRYETHVDEAAHARKLVGLDADGRRCFLRHTHTVTEDRFDIDEFPLEVAVLRERRIAWRLRSGRWLHVLDRMDRLDSCRPRIAREGPQVLDQLTPAL
jgi:hypothetical protein